MKVTVENLGRIKNASFDWKPLTVFVGENNTNKSWTAYCVYAISKWILSRQSFGKMNEDVEVSPSLDAAERYMQSKAVWPLALSIERGELLNEINSDTFKLSIDHRSIPKVLGLPPGACDSSRVEIEVDANNQYLHGYATFEARGNQFIEGNIRRQEIVNYFFKERNLSHGGVFRWPEYNTRVAGFARSLLFASFRDTFVFPSERIALSSLDSFLTGDFESKFSLPIVDYVESSKSAKRGGGGGNEINSQVGAYEDRITDLMESEILGGKLEVDYATNAINFITGADVRIDLKSTSSLVKSLSGLFLLLWESAESLRFFGRHLIVIDEPEMNAHPEAQRQIIELLVVLMNMGNHVLITTHSPYLVDQLNNLIDASKLPANIQQNFAEANLALKSKEAILNADDVGVYEFTTDGDIKDLFDREEDLIDTSTFGDVSNKIDATSFNIFEDLKAE